MCSIRKLENLLESHSSTRCLSPKDAFFSVKLPILRSSNVAESQVFLPSYLAKITKTIKIVSRSLDQKSIAVNYLLN